MELEQEIIAKNPEGVSNLVQSYGLPAPGSEEEALMMVYQLQKDNGAPFTEQFLNLLPEGVVIEGEDGEPKSGDKIEAVLSNIGKEMGKIPSWARLGIYAFMTYASLHFLFAKK